MYLSTLSITYVNLNVLEDTWKQQFIKPCIDICFESDFEMTLKMVFVLIYKKFDYFRDKLPSLPRKGTGKDKISW